MWNYCRKHIGYPVREYSGEFYLIYLVNEDSQTCVLVTSDGCLKECARDYLENHFNVV